MYLKLLEIQGFKSFPEKTRFEFGRGITAIVGPNGSGKSNVSDAVRWVLGEQSAKSLRGGRMEDVIFSGTSERKPLGFAQVTMTIDNSDNKLPYDFAEITVTRRVYRSGEGEYLLNGAAVRLKDVQEIFLDTGLGREGYSIIGQGKIDEILGARSEDRRLLFEEAAGITKYKGRKTEAERKLERQKQDILRAGDIIAEVESQLGPLGEQAEAAKQYLVLAERLKLVQISVFLREADGAEEKSRRLDRDIANARGQYELETTGREASGARRTALLAELSANDAETERARAAAGKLFAEIGGLENESRLSAQNTAHLLEDAERLISELSNGELALTKLTADRLSAEERRRAVSNELQEKQNLLTENGSKFALLNARAGDAEGLAALNDGIITKNGAISATRAESKRLDDLYAELEQKKERLGEEREALSDAFEQKNAEEGAAAKITARVEKELSELANASSFYETEIPKLSETERAENDRYIALVKKINEAAARRALLKELTENREGYYRGVKVALDMKKADPSRYGGVLGAVAELATVEPGYEVAIETALGASAQYIVTETDRDAKAMIEYLKRTNSGRASFMPLDAIRPQRGGEPPDGVLNERGVRGVAKDFLSYDPSLEIIFSYLLARTVVADNLENALALNKKYRSAVRIVTQDGELLSPGGVITGGRDPSYGRDSSGASGLFTRGRELDELNKTLPACEKDEAVTKAGLREIRSRLIKYRDALETGRAAYAKKQRELLSVSVALSEMREQLSAVKEKITALDAEDSALMERLIETNVSIRESANSLAEFESQLDAAREKLENFLYASADSREKRDALTAEATELKVSIGALAEQRNAFAETARRVEKEITKTVRENEKIKKELAGREAAREKIAVKIKKIEAEIEKTRALYESEQRRFAELIEKKATINAAVAETENDAASRGETLAILNAEIVRLETRKEQADADLKRLYDAMWDDYELTYMKAKEYPRVEKNAAQLAAEERSLRNAIRDMGAVNVGAAEEYGQKKERLDFLTAQRDDVVAGSERLAELIKALEEQMERRFVEMLDIISENFDAVFKEMFGGGQAKLLLSDESNVLTSGVEIKAQPPGKNLQILSLLSGGERALTAMALLFAILRMKPSPFCVLDEIEAALDESNVARFTDYIKKIARASQLILITHKRGTTAAADTLYGVTMQERGVSKLISVRFEDQNDEGEAV